MQTCINTRVHTHTHTRMHAFMHPYYLHTCIHAYILTYMQAFDMKWPLECCRYKKQCCRRSWHQHQWILHSFSTLSKSAGASIVWPHIATRPLRAHHNWPSTLLGIFNWTYTYAESNSEIERPTVTKVTYIFMHAYTPVYRLPIMWLVTLWGREWVRERKSKRAEGSHLYANLSLSIRSKPWIHIRNDVFLAEGPWNVHFLRLLVFWKASDQYSNLQVHSSQQVEGHFLDDINTVKKQS